MKVRIVYTLLLFVFSLCSLTSIAQLPTTKEQAQDEYMKANKAYQDADQISDDAYIDYNESDKARSFLETVKNDIELENRDNWEDLKEGAVELIMDLGQTAASRGRDIPISSMASSAINGVCDIVDWNTLQGQLSSVNSGLYAETTNTANLKITWESAVQTTEALKERSDLLYNHWLSFTNCAGCNESGAEHDLHASCWNSKWGCSETNVWSCTHDCDYEPVRCSGCSEKIAQEKHRSDADKAYHKQVTCGGCNVPYYLCDTNLSEYHRPRVCRKLDGFYYNGQVYHYYMGQLFSGFRTCNIPYRNCTNSGCTIGTSTHM